MKLEQSFEVAAPLERVWQTLIDVEHVAPCLPGAAVTGRNDDGSYNGTFTIKIGPTTASYTGKLEMEQVDEAAHTATMQAQGSDKRGQGGAKATIVSRLTSAGERSTRVEVDTDYHITGRLAMFGRGGMIEDISERLLKEFAARLQASLSQREGAGGAEAQATRARNVVPAGQADGGGAGQADEPAPLSTAGAEAAPPGAGAAPADEPAAADEPAPLAEAAPPPTEAAPPPTEAAAVVADAPATPAPGPTEAPSRERTSPTLQMPSVSDATAPPTSEPIEGLSLVGSVMLDRVKRNPAPLLGLLGALLLLLLLRRRR